VPDRISRERAKFTVFIDESMVERWDRASQSSEPAKVGHRLLVGGAVTSQPELLHESLQKEAAEVLADGALWEPRGGRPEPHLRRARFEKEGFHFVYDSPAIRERGFRAMCHVDLRLHVFYSNEYVPAMKAQDKEMSDLQIGMLFTMAHTLLRRYAGCDLTFVFENANDAIERLYGPILVQATEYLDGLNEGRGVARATASAQIGRKPDGGLSAADYALGIVNLDLGQGKVPQFEDGRRLLERAAPRVAHIMNFDRALHRRRFDSVDLPSWARHIVGVSSRPGVTDTNPILIQTGSTGPFTFWKSVGQLATGLGYAPETLHAVQARASRSDSYSFIEAKIKGKVRKFTVAKDPLLMDAQGRLAYLLNQFAGRLHPSCSAYVPGRGAADAARPHVGHRWAQRLDIADFFGNTTTARVQQTLEELGATDEVAGALASIMTYGGCLPVGSRTSPMMSNLVLAQFDYEVAEWADSSGLTYSRYADDMVFSGDGAFDAAPAVSERLASLGYVLNASKTRLKRRGQPFRVAGLTIDEGGPRVPKSLKRKLRLELHLLNTAVAKMAESTDEHSDALAQLDHADQMLYGRVRGLARYCIGVEFDWAMALLEKFPLAQSVIIGAPNPERRQAALKHSANRIRSRPEMRLGESNVPVGAPPALITEVMFRG